MDLDPSMMTSPSVTSSSSWVTKALILLAVSGTIFMDGIVVIPIAGILLGGCLTT